MGPHRGPIRFRLGPMPTAPTPPDSTFHHGADQPNLRRIVEHFTLITLLFAVSLYAIGQFETWKYIQAFGIPTTGIERGWETYVFTGAVSVINALTTLGGQSLRWVVPLAMFLASWAALTRFSGTSGSPLGRRALKTVLTLCTGCSYILLLLMLGMTWGIESARLVRAHASARTRYVVSPDAETNLPKAFSDANAKGSLRFVATGADSQFLFDPQSQLTFALPNRLIVCRVFEPIP